MLKYLPNIIFGKYLKKKLKIQIELLIIKENKRYNFEATQYIIIVFIAIHMCLTVGKKNLLKPKHATPVVSPR